MTKKQLLQFIGKEVQIKTKNNGTIYFGNPAEYQKVVSVDDIQIPTMQGFKTITRLVIKTPSDNYEHDIVPSRIKNLVTK